MYSRTHPLILKASPSRENSEVLIDYDDERLAWAKGLSEVNLRAIAVEYFKGKRTDDVVDAYKEYCHRFPDEVAESGRVHLLSKTRRQSIDRSRQKNLNS